MAADRLSSRKERSGGSFTSSRIASAVILGISLGALLAFWHPPAFSASNSVSSVFGGSVSLPVHTGSRRSSLSRNDDEITVLKKENEQLRLKEIELRKLVQTLQPATQQENGNDNHPAKAGPVGTMKSRRTNPLVEPDESANPALAEILKSVAINGELVVGVSNGRVLQMLQLWFENLKRAGVTNFLVVALDDETAAFCKKHDVHSYRRDAEISESQRKTGDNHAVSGLKFHLLRDFLSLGYSVLLSDVDIVYLQNPFHYLYRDCDVESMTDGFDNVTAYGLDDVSDDPSMGWARFAHTMRIWVFNSGLFYIRSTVASMELLDRVTARLSREDAWDQAVFNEELFYPSHPGYEGLHASKRVMDYYLFVNSKVLFKTLRKDDRWRNHKPVTIHVNYHPDKYERMLAIVDYYLLGNTKALDKFPDGSEW
ncbi:unnamed protein product [Calypogeia fissa]